MKISVVNGPNLNMLGKRNKEHYGTLTLKDIEQLMVKTFPEMSFEFFQSNHEGLILDYLHTLTSDSLIINAGAYTHTSIAIRDALEMLEIPKVEVHLSDVDNREPFRQTNYIKDVVNYRITGKKEQSYVEAVRYLLKSKVI
jgi:3-dehydroquinate dehydratase-2